MFSRSIPARDVAERCRPHDVPTLRLRNMKTAWSDQEDRANLGDADAPRGRAARQSHPHLPARKRSHCQGGLLSSGKDATFHRSSAGTCPAAGQRFAERSTLDHHLPVHHIPPVPLIGPDIPSFNLPLRVFPWATACSFRGGATHEPISGLLTQQAATTVRSHKESGHVSPDLSVNCLFVFLMELMK